MFKLGIEVRKEVRLKPGWRQEIYDDLRDLFEDGLRHGFFDTLIRMDDILVETGMSKASLLPLAAAVEYYMEFRNDINPVVTSKKGYVNINGKYVKGKVKTLAEGESEGEQAYKVFWGSKDYQKISFRFKIRVYQFLVHETGLHGFPARRALDYAIEEFKNYVRINGPSRINKNGVFTEIVHSGK